MLLRGLVFLCWFFSAVTCQAQAAPAGAIEISVGSDNVKRSIVPGGGLEEGQSFRDCDGCPEMVAVPAGALTLGKAMGARSPKPEHVTFAKPFAIGKFTVTVAEWNLCVADGGCGKYKMPEGMADDLPANPVNWYDAQAYANWLSARAGKHYRLPSDAEWEYAARAGTTTNYWWGNESAPGFENYIDKRRGPEKILPVKSYRPNPWGLYQTIGNVNQWVGDCKDEFYGTCGTERIMRGFSSAERQSFPAGLRVGPLGLRVVRDLP